MGRNDVRDVELESQKLQERTYGKAKTNKEDNDVVSLITVEDRGKIRK